MAKAIQMIPVSQILLDETIYPRSGVNSRRVNMFVENIQDGFKIDPIELQLCSDEPGQYRILDGAHRWHAYREIGSTEISAQIVDLDGMDPLLYAATKAIGPLQLTEEEARVTARRAYENNPRLTSQVMGRAIGRSRRTVDGYIADLRATQQLDIDIKAYRMNRVGIPQERIAARLGIIQRTVSRHLDYLAALPNSLNADLKKGFSITQVAEKHGWPEALVWSIALEGMDDLERFKALMWGLRTWDVWNSNDCDKRFGDDWPGRIPAQIIAHILYFFSAQGHLVFDPMAGGGVAGDTCLAFNRKCWSFDMEDRPDTRPEIEPHFWDIADLRWPVQGKTKPDLIIFDPPYFTKKSSQYDSAAISGMSRGDYLGFLESFFVLAHKNTKKRSQLAMVNADWRDFQNTPAKDETRRNAVLIDDYLRIINKSGWEHTHIIQAPLSSERFRPHVVAAMQKRKILGVTSRYVIVAKRRG